MSIISILLMAQFSAAQGELADIIKLNQQLPNVICDQKVIEQPARLSLNVEKPERPKTYLWKSAPLDEKKLIRFLLGDRSVSFGALKEGDADLEASKKALSLEFCRLVLQLTQEENIFEKKRDRLLQVVPLKSSTGLPRIAEANTWWLVDWDGRVGDFRGDHFIAGWIELPEVLAVRAGPRVYMPLSHPVTHRVEDVILISDRGIPEGKFQAGRSSDDSRKAQFLTYDLLMEGESYTAFVKTPSKQPEIKRLKEFYRNLMSAYELYPEEVKLAGNAATASRSLASEGTSFHGLIKDIQINGQPVNFVQFPNDPKLHQLYLDYIKKLSAL